jgi:toxin ParE1/3/4
MKIRWSRAAAADLENIVGYIRRDNPAVAQDVGRWIFERISTLASFPNSGRLGRMGGTRELPLPRYP